MPHRRTVLKTVAGASLLSASSFGRILGANDRVRVGLIGRGLIGKRHLASSHETAVPCHLANISMKLGRTLRWDEAKQDIVGDAEASAFLTREYRSPWDRELRAALPRG
jgi:hypothetical protein